MRLRDWKAFNRSGVIGLQLAGIAPATSTLGGLLLGIYLVSRQVTLLALAIALFAVGVVIAASGVSLLARNGTFYGQQRPHLTGHLRRRHSTINQPPSERSSSLDLEGGREALHLVT
jgi:hypothetical protein